MMEENTMFAMEKKSLQSTCNLLTVWIKLNWLKISTLKLYLFILKLGVATCFIVTAFVLRKTYTQNKSQNTFFRTKANT
jgi:predicted transcriptional regulator